MRILLGTVFVLLLVLEGFAESDQGEGSAGPFDPDEACHAVSPTEEVVVTTDGGGAVRGTPMCVSDAGVWLLLDGHLSSVSLERVRRIRTPADPVWDGGLKGAVIPLIAWGVFCRDCRPEPFLRMSLAYGVMGLVTDAIDTNRRTLYRRTGRSVGLGWSVRF